MLSYQHGYHAGNFADVVKHIVLTRILSYMTQKDKPLFYLETHSGKGLYDLYNKQSKKTEEFKSGIELIWREKQKLPAGCKEYLQCIKNLNQGEGLRYYPGSPAIAINLLRTIDRLYFCELHPAEFEELTTISIGKNKVHFSHTDGMAQLKALIPPPEKRGLIFIDPSFELKDEYKTIPRAINDAFSRFSGGTFCLWYPVVNHRLTEQLLRHLKEIKATNVLKIEFNLTMASMEGMSGCGLWIINPPYVLADELRPILSSLKSFFNPGVSSFIIESYTV